MAVLAGETIIAGKIPGERIATDIVTTNSAAVTAETVIQDVVAALVSGRIYRIRYAGAVLTSQASRHTRVQIREDSVSGTVLQTKVNDSGVDITYAAPVMGEAEYTAASTGNKTFVVTIERQTGTGTHTWQASSTAPAYLYVDYIRGP